MAERKAGVASYHDVDESYLDNRKLKKSAGWWLLWALGVGAVISGDYGGWNLGLKHAGFGGLAIGTLLMALMYVCMVFTIAELSAALPHAGGFFSFTRNAFGPTGGYICGLTDTIEYVITPPVIVYFIGGYMQTLSVQVEQLLALPAVLSTMPVWVWWLVFYLVFVAINIRGAELTLKVGLLVTLLSIAVLVIFYIGAIASGAFDPALLTNIDPAPGNSRWLPYGWSGIFAALPFAMWFYLAIEQLPLAAEESHDAARDMPKALIMGIATLLLLSILTLVLNTGVGKGAVAMADSAAPLADGFQAVFDASGKTTATDGAAVTRSEGAEASLFSSRAVPTFLTLVAITGLVASFHTIIYAYGRVLFALSRAGYFPRWISVTGKRHTPWVALLLGAVVGLFCAGLIEFTKPPAAPGETAKEGLVGAALLNMAVFGAVISYALVMASYIKLRISRPELPRPYRSPLGIPGAVIGGVLSIVALLATFSVEAYRPAVWGVAIFVALGIVYFLAYSRHHLVAQAPEEENALIMSAQQEITHQ
ncbi:MAG: amino acid permease [Planctomycetaceae bacterium]